MIRRDFLFLGGGSRSSRATLIDTCALSRRPARVSVTATGAKGSSLGWIVLYSGNGTDWIERETFRMATGFARFSIPAGERIRIEGWAEAGWARGTILCEDQKESRDVG